MLYKFMESVNILSNVIFRYSETQWGRRRPASTTYKQLVNCLGGNVLQ